MAEVEWQPEVIKHSRLFRIPNFCVVSAGCWKIDGSLCSVKTYEVKELLDKEEKWLKRQREIICHSKLEVYLFPYEKNGKTVGIVTELLPYTLRIFLSNTEAQRKCLPREFKRSILMDIVLAMRYLHSQGLAHRSLNPHNVYLTQYLTAKVGNFYTIGPTKEQVGTFARDFSIDYDKPNQESSTDFLPINYEHEFGETLDYFAFDCLILFTLTHEWPTPTTRYTTGSTQERSEFDRREGLVKDIVDNDLGTDLFPIIETCLDDEASKHESFQWIYGELKTDLFSHMQQQTECLRELILTYWQDKVKNHRDIRIPTHKPTSLQQ